MGLITSNLVSRLDASSNLMSGFANGATLLNNSGIPDLIGGNTWYSSGFGLNYVLSAQNNLPAFRFQQGNLTPNFLNSFLSYTEMTVIIAAKRTGQAYNGTWMGLYSMWYNQAQCGTCVFALTDSNNNKTFLNWGTWGGGITTSSASSMDINIPQVIAMTSSSSMSGTFYTNGVSGVTYRKTQSVPFFGLGGNGAPLEFFVGDVYEVLQYSRMLTDAEILSSSASLMTKWFS